MKQLSISGIVVGVFLLFSSCDDGCRTCTYTYINEQNSTTEDWCNGETLEEVKDYYEVQEQTGVIESDWSCN